MTVKPGLNEERARIAHWAVMNMDASGGIGAGKLIEECLGLDYAAVHDEVGGELWLSPLEKRRFENALAMIGDRYEGVIHELPKQAGAPPVHTGGKS